MFSFRTPLREAEAPPGKGRSFSRGRAGAPAALYPSLQKVRFFSYPSYFSIYLRLMGRICSSSSLEPIQNSHTCRKLPCSDSHRQSIHPAAFYILFRQRIYPPVKPSHNQLRFSAAAHPNRDRQSMPDKPLWHTFAHPAYSTVSTTTLLAGRSTNSLPFSTFAPVNSTG